MRVRVLRSQVTYTATFARPAYGFVGRWLDLYAAINNRFTPFDARPEDVRFENPSGVTHEFLVSWTSFRHEVIVRYRLGNFEVWTRNPRLIRGDTPPVVEVIAAATAAAQDIVPGLTLASQTANVNGHGSLERVVRVILRSLVNSPEWARPDGLRFGVPAGDGIEAIVDLQPSLEFPDQQNAWAGVTLVFPGTVTATEVCVRTASFVKELLGRVAVDLDWGDQ